jgi:hypothetical protein
MRIIKRYEVVLNLSAQELFSNINATIMDKLRKQFEGRCYKSSLIMTIKEVEKRSPVTLATSILNGSGDVNVQFTAESIIYQEGDILSGCEVVRIERNNRIICKYEHAVVNLRGNKNLQNLKPGQFINVQVNGAVYPIFHDKITINALPYAYSTKFTIYFTTLNAKAIPLEQIQLIKEKLSDIDAEYKLYSAANTKVVKFLNELYYPYKTAFNPKQKLEKYLEFDDIYEIASSLVAGKKGSDKRIGLCRHPLIDKSSPTVLSVGAELLQEHSNSELLNAETYEISAVEEIPGTVVLKLLDDYLKYIRMLRESAEIYGAEKKLDEHSNIWNIYNRMKK